MISEWTPLLMWVLYVLIGVVLVEFASKGTDEGKTVMGFIYKCFAVWIWPLLVVMLICAVVIMCIWDGVKDFVQDKVGRYHGGD